MGWEKERDKINENLSEEQKMIALQKSVMQEAIQWRRHYIKDIVVAQIQSGHGADVEGAVDIVNQIEEMYDEPRSV